MFVFGGHNGNAFYNHIYFYDCDLQYWKKVENVNGIIPSVRSCSSFDLLENNKAILIGGYGPDLEQDYEPPSYGVPPKDIFFRFKDVFIAHLP
jgi:hypothetical protein